MAQKPDFKIDRENLDILDFRQQRKRDFNLRPEIYWPWFPFCTVRVLVVTDGNLDFSDDDFGLATFVRTLLNTSVPARFNVTLGHLNNRSGDQMMEFDTRIARRIANFKFDDTDDFAPDMYDVVFLLGISVTLSGRGNDANGNPYPTNRLADTELDALAQFQNGGGGLFATGDHGALGRYMGQALPRAGKMRLWDSTSADSDLDEVSMGGPRRNDTNRPGDPGSQFDDQSDDIPQSIIPKIYSVTNFLFKYSFPHPLLCGPNGVIRVMPDHPHEGECVEPTDTDDTLSFIGNHGPEFPPASGGGPRPLPEVISTNLVLAGTTSGTKDPTIGHTFGGICAYDGHRANVGRVVTDATWHHFVNINLVGDADYSDALVKGQGFMASAAGQTHLQNIRAYYRNLAVWLSRRSNIRCMNSGWLVWLYRKSRVMEAVLTRTDLKFDQLKVINLWQIGRHARDVLGKYASQCQSRRLILDLIWPEFDPGIPTIDPWVIDPEFNERAAKEDFFGVNWVNGENVLDAALGGAIAAINEHIGERFSEPYDPDEVAKVAQNGARQGMKVAVKALEGGFERLRKQVRW